MTVAAPLLLASCVNGGGVFLVEADGVERLSQVDTTGLATGDVAREAWMARQADGVAELRRIRGGAIDRIFLAHDSYDLHDLVQHDGHLYVVATALNAVLELSVDTMAEVQRWQSTGEPDSQHVNSICVHDGRLLATRFGTFASHRGYKGHTRLAGQVFDVRTGEVLVEGLSQPHSLRSSNGELWLCDSEARTVRVYRDFAPVAAIAMGAYVRGLAFDGDTVHVGLSRGRNDPDSTLASACVVSLDRQTWERRRSIALPVDEVYDLLLVDIEPLALRSAALQEAFSDVDSMRHSRNLSSQAAHDHQQRAEAIAQAAHGATLRGDALAAQVGALQAQVRDTARDLRDARALLDEQVLWSDMLEAQAAAQRTALAMYGQAIEERDRLIQSVLASRSWRWTQALRRGRPAVPVPVALLDAPAFAEMVANRGDLPIGGLAFVDHAEPDVSIVVASHGQFDATLACLRSIQDAGASARFEVLLAEDRSGEVEMDRFAHVPGLHYHCNDHNMGFGGSMNAAVQRARGGYIHLLNNDTTVTPGWLDALLQTFSLFGDCGVVGSKLVYPDGTLQEAGGIVWSDGSGCNYGRGDNPMLSTHQVVRAVDYVSGASLLLRASVWRALGGFDSRYAPAYYEDTDLAFRVRDAGLCVYLQPASLVVHREGLSHGTDIGAGGKAGQVRNQAVFVARWHETLARGQLAPGAHPFLARERSQLERIMLLVDSFPPQSDRDAGSRAIWQLMHVLRLQGWRIKFWSHETDYDPGYAANLRMHGIDLLDAHSDGPFADWIAANGLYLDAVLLSRPMVARAYMDLLRDTVDVPMLYYGHDLHFLRIRGQFALTGDPELQAQAESLWHIEHALWRGADLVLYPSDSETALAGEFLRSADARGTAMTVPLFAYEDVADPADADGDGLARRDELLFVGGFGHLPNADGVAWFLREVWPQVRSALPGISLRVVGADPTAEIRSFAAPDVHVAGHVSEADLVAAYGRARVVIAPLRFGAGTKGKVIEAMRYGVPCVTTAIGAQGLLDAAHLGIADDPAAMAARIIALAGDDARWVAASQAGIAYVRERFSVAAVWSVLGSVLPAQPYADVMTRLATLQQRETDAAGRQAARGGKAGVTSDDAALRDEGYSSTPPAPIPSHSE